MRLACCSVVFLGLIFPGSAIAGGGTCPSGYPYIAVGTKVEGRIGPSDIGAIRLSADDSRVTWSVKPPYTVTGIFAIRANSSYASEDFNPGISQGHMALKQPPDIVEACLEAGVYTRTVPNDAFTASQWGDYIVSTLMGAGAAVLLIWGRSSKARQQLNKKKKKPSATE